MNFAPQPRNAKNIPLNRPSKYKPPWGLVLGNCPQYKVKQSKNGKFPFNWRLAQSMLKRKSPSVDKPLRIWAPPKISPSKRAFEKCKPRGLFSEVYGMLVNSKSYRREERERSYPVLVHNVLISITFEAGKSLVYRTIKCIDQYLLSLKIAPLFHFVLP